MISPILPVEQLAQVRPSGTSATSGLAPGYDAIVTLIYISNTTAVSADFGLFHDDDGTTFDATTSLHTANVLPGNASIQIEFEPTSGLALSAAGAIGVQTSVADALTFTFYGVRRR